MPDSPIKPPSVEPMSYQRPRPIRSPLERAKSVARSWMRVTFSRESLLSSLRTFLWVVPLTVLIWIYAEREQLGPPQKVEFSIQAKNSDPTRWVRIVEAGPDGRIVRASGKLTADLTGPHGRVELVEQKLAVPSYPIEFPRLDPGIHTVSASQVGNDPVFVNNGVTASGFVPRDLILSVDVMTTVKVEVQVRPKDRENIEKVEFEPRSIDVSVPETFRKEHPDLTVYADLQDLRVPGPHEENISLSPSINDPDSHIVLSRPTIHASYTVNPPTQVGHILSLAVWPCIPPLPDFWKSHHVEFQNNDSTLRNVAISGPSQLVNSSVNGVKGEFDVNESTTSTAYIEAPVRIVGLPEGVKLETNNWKIYYKVVDNTPGDK